MKVTHPADGRRLDALLSRLHVLRRCDVRISRDQMEALRRVVDILRYDERKAAARAYQDGPPPGFGKL